jgi:phage terminase small subunit
MTLTQKQENFCLAYIELGNASEAYRRFYNAARMKAATVNRRATELLANGTITARIAELRARVSEKAVLDRTCYSSG